MNAFPKNYQWSINSHTESSTSIVTKKTLVILTPLLLAVSKKAKTFPDLTGEAYIPRYSGGRGSRISEIQGLLGL